MLYIRGFVWPKNKTAEHTRATVTAPTWRAINMTSNMSFDEGILLLVTSFSSPRIILCLDLQTSYLQQTWNPILSHRINSTLTDVSAILVSSLTLATKFIDFMLLSVIFIQENNSFTREGTVFWKCYQCTLGCHYLTKFHKKITPGHWGMDSWEGETWFPDNHGFAFLFWERMWHHHICRLIYQTTYRHRLVCTLHFWQNSELYITSYFHYFSHRSFL